MNEHMPRVRILPLSGFQRYLHENGSRDTAVLISTSYPVSEAVTCPEHCLVLTYDDVDREIPGRSISEEAARSAAEFLQALADFPGTLFCCCDSGVSRSSAVAASACVIWGRDDLPIWQNPAYSPNPYVFAAICTAAHAALPDEALDFRIEQSRRAFTDAIRRQTPGVR